MSTGKNFDLKQFSWWPKTPVEHTEIKRQLKVNTKGSAKDTPIKRSNITMIT